MTEPVEPQQPSVSPANQDRRDLLTYLREESQANRDALREESDSNRKLFLGTSAIVAIPLTVLLTLSGIFFYHDVNTMKEAMEAQGKASAQVEIQKMDSHIEDTLQEQFKTEKIQLTIQQAAEKATREQAPGLIKEVITPEVKRAVENQSGTIKEVATRAATDEVKSAIDPIVGDVKLQGVIARANADDARAFDELLATRDKGSQSQKDLVNGVIVNLQRRASEVATVDRTSYYSECANPSGTAYQALLASPLLSVRKDAIADCIAYMDMGQWVPKLLDSVSAFSVVETVAPMWMKVALHDSSLSVRAQAIAGLNWLFKGGYGVPNNGFDLLDTYLLKEWWTRNVGNQAAIALVAFAHGGLPMMPQVAGRDDQIDLYDEAQRITRNSPWSAQLEQLREQMRMRASFTTISPQALTKEISRSCEDAAKDLVIRMQGFRALPGSERTDGYGLLELQYLNLPSCSIHGQIVTAIAEYAAVTRSMSTRYFAVSVVNKSSGLKLDPYDSRPIQGWLKTHSGSTGH